MLKFLDLPAAKEVDVEQDGFLKCPFCEEVFADLSDFAAHTNEDHPAEAGSWSRCSQCELRFPNSSLLDKV